MQSTKQEQADLIIGLEYRSGDVHLTLCVRVVTRADMARMFRFETWKNDQEDLTLRFESTDVYAVQRKFVARVVDMYGDGWKREQIQDGEPNVREYMQYFDPRLYCAAEKPDWALRDFSTTEQQVRAEMQGLTTKR
ncbi:MAG TPA: hypothetical protein VGI45_11090 [Terracidiphilus sp.]|jgi:hypothetical protein